MTKAEFLAVLSIPALVVLYIVWSQVIYKDFGPVAGYL